MTDHQLAPQGEVPQKLDILATINDFLTVGSKLSFAGGFLALVWYCVTEGVAFPINSLSQAVSTFAVAFVLVLLLGMLAVYSYLVIQPALFIHSGFRRRKNGERFWGADFGDRLLLAIGLLLDMVLLIGIVVGWQAIDIKKFLLGAAAVCGSGGILHLLFEPRDMPSPLGLKLIAPGTILVLLLMAFGSWLIPASMTALGIRSMPGQLVIIATDSHDWVQALATVEALTLEAEQIGEDQWLYPKATVLWSGLGGPATVKFEGQRHDLRVSLPEGDVRISSIGRRGPISIAESLAKSDEPATANY